MSAAPVSLLESDSETREWEAACDCVPCAIRVDRGLAPVCHEHPWSCASLIEGGYYTAGRAVCASCGALLALEYRLGEE